MATQTVVGTLYKDPNETRTYYMDWSAAIGVNIIVESEWTVADGVTTESSGIAESDTKTHITLSGGTAGESYLVTNTVTLATGEIFEKSGLLRVRQQ